MTKNVFEMTIIFIKLITPKIKKIDYLLNMSWELIESQIQMRSTMKTIAVELEDVLNFVAKKGYSSYKDRD